MNTSISRFARKLLIALLPVALLAMTAQPVSAARYWIDGSDPYATGCANSAVAVFSTWTGSGLLTLKFSRGCITAWAESTCSSPSHGTRSRAAAQMLEQPVEVGPDCVLRKRQLCADLLVGQPERHQRDDLLLTWRELMAHFARSLGVSQIADIG